MPEDVLTDEQKAARAKRTEGARAARAKKAAGKTPKQPLTDEQKEERRKARAADLAKAREVKQRANEEAQANVYKTLKPKIKDITSRIERAKVSEGKAADLRLSASIVLAEAKQHCEDMGVAFKKWCEDELGDITYHTARELARVGVAEQQEEGAGVALLEDLRARSAKRNAKKREAAKTEKPKSLPAPAGKPARSESQKTADDVYSATRAVRNMKTKDEKRNFVKSLADEAGMQLVEKDGKPLPPAAPVDLRGEGALVHMRTIFGKLTFDEKEDFVAWACKQIDASVEFAPADDPENED